MKRLKYDYAKLDEFLKKDYPEKEILLECFSEFCGAYASMATWIVSQASHDEIIGVHVNENGAAYMHRYLEMFKILNDLPETQEGGES